MVPALLLGASPLQPTVFICNQWLQDPDRAVHPTVELLPGGELPETLHYKVQVVTSDIKVGGP